MVRENTLAVSVEGVSVSFLVLGITLIIVLILFGVLVYKVNGDAPKRGTEAEEKADQELEKNLRKGKP